MPAAALAGLDGLDHALHAELPSVAGRCTTVPNHAPGLDGLQPDAAPAVADERDVLPLRACCGAGRALVGADDQVEVGLRLEHRLRGLQRVGRVVERLALGDDVDPLPAVTWSKPLRMAVSSDDTLTE